MNRNLTIGIASGVATAVALGLVFGTEKGKRTYKDALDKCRNSNLASKLGMSKDDGVEYPNETSKTVAE